jgi:hypothetical protein
VLRCWVLGGSAWANAHALLETGSELTGIDQFFARSTAQQSSACKNTDAARPLSGLCARGPACDDTRLFRYARTRLGLERFTTAGAIRT